MKKIFLFIFLIFSSIFLTSCGQNSDEFVDINNSDNKIVNDDKVVNIDDEELKDELPNNYTIIDNLINDKKFDEAIKFLEKQEFEAIDILTISAKIDFEKKDFKGALKKQLEINEELEWKDHDQLYFLGAIYDNLWDKELAVEYIKKSLEIKPDYVLAKEYLDVLIEQINKKPVEWEIE